MKTRLRYGKKQKKRRGLKGLPAAPFRPEDKSLSVQELHSVTACPERFQWQQVSNLQRLAAGLLDQQLWCFGQDIEYSAGNLLLQYGFEKQLAPSHVKATSLYRYQQGPHCQLILRGFGLFYGDDRWGGLFIRRCEFRPLYWPAALLLKSPWRVEDLPQFQEVGAATQEASRELMFGMIGCLCDYEQWVLGHCGPGYREKCLQRWESSKKQVIRGPEVITAWKKIAANWSPAESLPLQEPEQIPSGPLLR